MRLSNLRDHLFRGDLDTFWNDTLRWVQTCDSLILVTLFVVLMVLDPPKQDTTFCQETNYSLAVGDTKQICCPVSGYPPPFFTWKKDGVQLKGEDSVLTITISGKKDFGNYTCSATDFRTSSKAIYISIKEKGNYVRGLAWMIWLKSPVLLSCEQVGFFVRHWLALASYLENESLPKTSKQWPWASKMWTLMFQWQAEIQVFCCCCCFKPCN